MKLIVASSKAREQGGIMVRLAALPAEAIKLAAACKIQRPQFVRVFDAAGVEISDPLSAGVIAATDVQARPYSPTKKDAKGKPLVKDGKTVYDNSVTRWELVVLLDGEAPIQHADEEGADVPAIADDDDDK